jgi:type II secretory pathway pseudopilin PulG
MSACRLPCSGSSPTAKRQRQAGFTMIELTVSLVAGLIVAMGIIGLSREATNTFNEEARTTAAEAGLRVAIERLRADVQRAGYMSTGNILRDPSVAHVPGLLPGAGNAAGYLPVAGAPAGGAGAVGMFGLQNLAALYWLDNGSSGNNVGLSASQTPALTPDLIQIAGNMTTSEQFDVQMVASTNAACAAGGTVITLYPNSAAMLRTLGGTPTAGNVPVLQSIFAPDPGSSFLLRLVDKTGHAQFLATCPTTVGAFATTGIDASQNPFVRVDGGNTPVLYATAGANNISTVGGVSGFCAGCMVNPVQIVQWEITNSSGGGTDTEPNQNVNIGFLPLTQAADTDKYDLMRSFLDAKGNIVANTSEVVAEYAVDLSFAFTGDNGTSLVPAGTTSVTSCAFDQGACNAAWAQQAYAAVPPQGPQRIRSVRARLTTRAALPDRSATIAITPAQYGTQTFLYRYSLPAGVYPPPFTYARARTVSTEVSLPNLSRNFY